MAILTKDGTEDTGSDEARQWDGLLEQHRFVEKGGVTEVIVDITTQQEFGEMFSFMWPSALVLLKGLCERADA